MNKYLAGVRQNQPTNRILRGVKAENGGVMYLVGALIETKGAHMLQMEIGNGVIGFMPVYKNKTFAKKRAGKKYPVYEIAPAIKKELT